MQKNTNQLNAEELKQLQKLNLVCKSHDGSAPNLYTHILTQPRAIPASLLYYEQEQLIGFLGIYFFYNDAVEVSLLIDPAYRRQGIGTKLILSLIPLIESQNFQKLIFSSPAELNDSWLSPLGFTYLHSEYYMERNGLNPLLEPQLPSLNYRFAIPEDIPILSKIDEACFPNKQLDAAQRFKHIIDSREYQIVLAYQNNKPIGKAHLHWLAQGATLSDIAVIPQNQGQGLGTSLITHCINLVLAEGKSHINLDVETHNERALKLYTKLGFITANACDYWSIPLKNLLIGLDGLKPHL